MKDFPEYVKENLDKLTRDDLIYLIREYDHTWSCIGYAIDKIRCYLSKINGLNPRSNRLDLEIKLRKGEITPDEYRKIVLGE